jgi:hypothetical protein
MWIGFPYFMIFNRRIKFKSLLRLFGAKYKREGDLKFYLLHFVARNLKATSMFAPMSLGLSPMKTSVWFCSSLSVRAAALAASTIEDIADIDIDGAAPAGCCKQNTDIY